MKKGCLTALLIVLGIIIVVGLLGWFVIRPWAIKKFCQTATNDMVENSAIKMTPSAYYDACLKKYGIEN